MRGAENAHRELRRVLEYAHACIIEAAAVSIPVSEAMIGPDGLVAATSARAEITQAVDAMMAEVCAPSTML